jgi:hypothetical protein
VQLATWNLERGGRTLSARAAQSVALNELRADLIVFTEPGSRFQGGAGVVTSPPTRPRSRSPEPWIAIVGEGVEPVLDMPYGRLAAAARVTVGGRTMIVYGTVLPWLTVNKHAPELVAMGETSFDAFVRILNEQVNDIEELRRQHGFPVVWAGDFNQSVSGTVAGGSFARREVLAEALDHLGMAAWNGDAGHALPGLCAVDLICGSRDIVPASVTRIDPTRDGVTMTDHAGYCIAFTASASVFGLAARIALRSRT